MLYINGLLPKSNSEKNHLDWL